MGRPQARPVIVCKTIDWKTEAATFSLLAPSFKRACYVRFGEYTAASRNRVQRIRAFGQFVEPYGIRMEQRRHLIDKGSCPAGAGAVHTMLVTACEICDFSVFAAQFDNNVRLRMVRADGLCTGNDLLNKRDMQMVSQSPCRRSL